MSGFAAVSWDGSAAKTDDSTTKIVRRLAPGSYRASVRYKAAPGQADETAGRILLVPGKGRPLRTILLSGDARRPDADGWRIADVEFLVSRETAVSVRVQVPAGCVLMIDYLDLRLKEGQS